MEQAIMVRDLCKDYGKKRVLDQIDLTLTRGEIYGLIGKNGAGKTTLMRILTGLAQKTSGEFSIFGSSQESELNQKRHRIGTMIETPAFFPYLTASQNLEYYRIQRGIVEKTIIDQVLEEVGLHDTGKKQFKNFSLGMKQRLGLALALLNHPDLLILDEPINGLDPQGIAEFRSTLLRLHQDTNMTMFISSHILAELSSVATYYGIMDQGKMIEEISAKELEEKCRTYIQVCVQDSVKTVRLLERNLGITAYEVLEEGKIRIYEQLDSPEDISDVIVLNGVKLYSMENKRIDLEQYFLNRIGGEQPC